MISCDVAPHHHHHHAFPSYPAAHDHHHDHHASPCLIIMIMVLLLLQVNALELEFLFSINFSLHVPTDVYERYYAELANHMGVGVPVSAVPCR